MAETQKHYDNGESWINGVIKGHEGQSYDSEVEDHSYNTRQKFDDLSQQCPTLSESPTVSFIQKIDNLTLLSSNPNIKVKDFEKAKNIVDNFLETANDINIPRYELIDVIEIAAERVVKAASAFAESRSPSKSDGKNAINIATETLKMIKEFDGNIELGMYESELRAAQDSLNNGTTRGNFGRRGAPSYSAPRTYRRQQSHNSKLRHKLTNNNMGRTPKQQKYANTLDGIRHQYEERNVTASDGRYMSKIPDINRSAIRASLRKLGQSRAKELLKSVDKAKALLNKVLPKDVQATHADFIKAARSFSNIAQSNNNNEAAVVTLLLNTELKSFIKKATTLYRTKPQHKSAERMANEIERVFDAIDMSGMTRFSNSNEFGDIKRAFYHTPKASDKYRRRQQDYDDDFTIRGTRRDQQGRRKRKNNDNDYLGGLRNGPSFWD